MPTREEFSVWLERYGEAWKRTDAHAAGQLFTENAVYYEVPFEEPVRGRPAIVEYWDGVRGHRDVELTYEVLAVTDDLGIARLQDAFTRVASGRRAQYDGIFVVHFDADLKCREFREWWVEIPQR